MDEGMAPPDMLCKHWLRLSASVHVALCAAGYLAGGYPQRPGAANCPFYMYSGECKFKSKCMFHHPEQVVHPMRFVLTGALHTACRQHAVGAVAQTGSQWTAWAAAMI